VEEEQLKGMKKVSNDKVSKNEEVKRKNRLKKGRKGTREERRVDVENIEGKIGREREKGEL